jgi:hypothetical protein
MPSPAMRTRAIPVLKGALKPADADVTAYVQDVNLFGESRFDLDGIDAHRRENRRAAIART